MKNMNIAYTPWHTCHADIAISACRSGEIGILDLGSGQGNEQIAECLRRLKRFAHNDGKWGIRWDMLFEAERSPAMLSQYLSDRIPVLILAGMKRDTGSSMEELLGIGRAFAEQVLYETSTLQEAREAEKAGFDGIILKGNEAGGYTGSRSAFILLQQACRKIKIPFWIQGGMGRHTASAAILAGATGVVLCEQLWLTQESPLTEEEKKVFKRLDGSETCCLGKDGTFFRFFCKNTRQKFRELETQILRQDDRHSVINSSLLHQDQGEEAIIPCGQDIGLAADLAERFGTVGNVLKAVRQSTAEHLELAGPQCTLAADAPLAKWHTTRYPFVQGPMANISDTAAFCKAVAEAGALPCVALSALPGPNAREVLELAQGELSDRPWAVGILGFLPRALLDEQFKVIEDVKPRFAVIAGGRPGQVRKLQSVGVSAYLHAPSPGLVSAFLKEGTRRFALEGRECGGHVGPLSSFVLWESTLNRLLDEPLADPADLCILFAGGITDGLSAAMVQTIAATLSNRGAKIGIMMGTAYLFSQEAVQSGAITPAYQQEILQCNENVLLHSGLGHASCCVNTPFIEKFYKEKQKLMLADVPDAQILQKLETLNLGRLMIAAKGIACRFEKSPNSEHVKHTLVLKEAVDETMQRDEGLFMAGQVAQLHDSTFKIADLHHQIAEYSTTLAARSTGQAVILEDPPPVNEDIAIVGISGIFPEADNYEQLWHNILQGRCSIREIPASRWNIKDFYDPDRTLADKTFSKWGGFLNDIPFDPTWYGIAPKVLESTDALQLLALEVTRRALEDAGYHRRAFARERTAVIFGAEGMNDLAVEYAVRAMSGSLAGMSKGVPEEILYKIFESLHNSLPEWTSDSFPGILTNLVSGRVANRFDLGGTNLTCQAACATSLAALEIGLRQLWDRSCDVCLVGSVDLGNNPFGYIMFSRSQALSPTGLSRPLDNAADGIVLSEGGACLVLKRLSDAEKDGDRIYAVIKGFGSSSDGRKRSLVAPAPEGQVRALISAYRSSRIDPASVQLLELHGTGTVLGDKVEIDSISQAFGKKKKGSRPSCAIGSVKSNIGHTKLAAGLAGIIKVVMSLKNKVLPPTTGVTVPNKKLDLNHSPFYINTELRPWIRTDQDPPRRAGVSSYGFGGTNFHVVFEEYDAEYRQELITNSMPRDAEIFAFAEHDPSALKKSLGQFREGLASVEKPNLAQLAFSVYQDSEKHLALQDSCRLNLVASSKQELANQLDLCLKRVIGGGQHSDPQGIYYDPGTGRQSESRQSRKVCFLFPGQGSQRVNMLRDLLFAGTGAHETLALGDSVTCTSFQQRLSDYMYPFPVFSDAARRKQQNELNLSPVAQPALAVANLVALDVLLHFGFKPDFLAGHSFGEYVALCAAGCISREELMHISEARGRIVGDLSKNGNGVMAAVQTDGRTTADIVERARLAVHIANYNAPDQTVISGMRADIEKALGVFQSKKIPARNIPVSAAFHSHMMEEAGRQLAACLSKIDFQAPNKIVFSNTTSQSYPHDPDQIRKLLEKHICEPVHFDSMVRNLHADGVRIFIETGPGKTLTNLVNRILAEEPHSTFCMDEPGRSGWTQLAHLLAHSSILGLDVNIKKWFEGRLLSLQGTEEYFRKAEAAKNPGPMVWRICGGRAVPWHKKGLNPYEEKIILSESDPSVKGFYPPKTNKQTPPLSAKEHPIKKQTETKLEDRSAMIKNTTHHQNMRQTIDSSEKGFTGNPIYFFNQCQNALGQFIAMQQEQQKTAQYFINIQKKMLDAAYNNDNIISSGHCSPSLNSLGFVPAPEIPDMLFEPADAAPLHTVPQSSNEDLSATISQAAPQQDSMHVPVTPPISITAPSTKTHAASTTIPGIEEFKTELIRIAAERTGFEPDMLSLESNMETDLGIDSIKKVEIFSMLRERFDIMNQLDEDQLIEEIADLATLGSVIEWFDGKRKQMMEKPPEAISELLPSMSYSESAN